MKKYILVLTFLSIFNIVLAPKVLAINDNAWGLTPTQVKQVGQTSNGQTAAQGGQTSNGQTASQGGQTSNGQVPPQGGQTSSEAPLKLDDPLGPNISLEGLLLMLFDIILYVGVPVVAFFLIYSGFMFVTASGNTEKIETAKSRLLYTIIGAILLLGAWTIAQAIKGSIEDIKNGASALLDSVRYL